MRKRTLGAAAAVVGLGLSGPVHPGPDTMTRTVHVWPQRVRPNETFRVASGRCAGDGAEAYSPAFRTRVALTPDRARETLAGTASVNGRAAPGTYPVRIVCRTGGRARGEVTVRP
ncbi:MULTISPECIES: hypothetical protein [Actinomadura]|uniref:Ig-like domain-containing protein n=1 Tax=Actinomadura yumaensis TaxID=111807 RepID=A0ABW2CH64_9ACTN|nr:hypothetical protein [Actinomadura sp. J1-007]MWK34810.1 hypothetical protein [Actinomadura sp. J1-007]